MTAKSFASPIIVFFALYLFSRVSPLHAQEIQIGAKYDRHIGISLLLNNQDANATHIAATIAPKRLAILDIEHHDRMTQYATSPLLDSSFYARPYWGVGVRGSTSPTDRLGESIFGKGILGLDVLNFKSPISCFIDAQILIGPSRKTNRTFLGRIGIRTKI